MRRSLLFLALVLAIPSLWACTEDATGPDPIAAAVVGEWHLGGEFGAFSLTTIIDGEVTDWLSLGARVELDLHEDGTTSGSLFIPGGDEDGGDFDADLSGTWDVRAGLVHFEHDADTFIRDMPFSLQGNTLHGDETFSGDRVILTLVRR